MNLVRGLLTALAFLTRIPVPGAGAWRPGAAGMSVVFFPAVGLLLGAASAGMAALLLDRLGLPPHPLWALALVGLHALLTGALHLDGLSDLVDGLGGSRGDRDRALEIMRDPRIGAFGVVALILVLGAKVLAMAEILRMSARPGILLAYPVAPRLGAAFLVVFLPTARATGLAATFHQEAHWPMAVAAAVLTAAFAWAQGASMLVPSASALGAAVVVGLLVAARLRGLTGDAYGAAIELAELAFLIAAAFPGIRGS
jgi:adenosylcobinamide-GDP ribazoletransferase